MTRPTSQEVAEAAEEGCSSCLLLQTAASALGDKYWDAASDREVVVTYREGNTLIMALDVGEGSGNTRGSREHAALELFMIRNERCPWPGIGPDITYLNPSTGAEWIPGGEAAIVPVVSSSAESFSRIKGWMAQCETDHPFCDLRSQYSTRSESRAWHPKRVIDVGTGDFDIFLRPTDGQVSRYVALSYCWGRSGGLRLVKSNVTNLSSRLPWHELLQTHKDSIMIARRLGFKYLWVDALCIVQDDGDEKGTEIARMDSIYANAYLTIAATGSSGGDEGCFGSREPTVQICTTEVDGSRSSVWARRALDHSVFDWAPGDVFSSARRRLSNIGDTYASLYPIFQRGWTFQERLLSPRILHFTKSEMVWECLGMTSCECGALDEFAGSRVLRERRFAAGLPQDVEVRCGKLERSRTLAKRLGVAYTEERGILARDRMLPSFVVNDYATMFAILGEAPELEDDDEWARRRWRDLASQYSERSLSYVSDALPAISGLAAVWRHRSKGTARYLAGLWDDDLVRGLLWECVDRSVAVRPEQYLAPSWSYACIRRQVDWLPDDLERCIHRATVLKASCHLKNDLQPFGEVTSGQLEVKGLCVRAMLEVNDVQPDSRDASVVIPRHDRNSDEACKVEFQDGKRPKSHYKGFSFRVDCIPEVQKLDGSGVHCLWWCTDVNDTRSESGFERFLVLKACDTRPGTFTRIGIIEYFGSAEQWDVLHEKTTLTIV